MESIRLMMRQVIRMNRSREMEKYLMLLLPEEPEEITATALQREYKNGYLDGQKKAYDECDKITRELSQIKSGCSKWLDGHDEKIRADERAKVLKAVIECGWHCEVHSDKDLFEMVEKQLKEGETENYKICKKLNIDDKILVSDTGDYWEKRHFAGYDPKSDYIIAFDTGTTSWTASEKCVTRWKYVKLPEEGEQNG